MFRSKVAGVGSFLPEKKLTNKDLEARMDTSDEWIKVRTGISSRSIATDGLCTTDLALTASKRALDDAKMSATDIDSILFATFTGDYILPSSASILQSKLGTRNCMGCRPFCCLQWFSLRYVYGRSIYQNRTL